MSNRVPEFFDIAGIDVDGQNVIFNLNRANANMAGCLADPLFLIMDTSIDNSNIATEGPVCTGPYAFQSFDPDGDTVVVQMCIRDSSKMMDEAISVQPLSSES